MVSRYLALQCITTLLIGASAQAASTNIDANAVSAPAKAAVECENFCGLLVDQVTKDYLGLDGTPGWKGQSDDQWCANHGVVTQPSVQPGNTTPYKGANCNVPMLNGDTNCADVNARLVHCKFHGSQAELQCMAYETATKAKDSEKIILGLDVA